MRFFMNSFLKWIGIVLAGFVLFMVLVALMLPMFIDPNNYRDDITKLVHDQTGLTLSINGPISWSVFPWLGFSIEKVMVAGIDSSKLAELKSAEISIKLLPLIRKSIEIKNASLIGLKFELVRNKNGVGNWGISRPKTTQIDNNNAGTDTKAAKINTKKISFSELDIASVEVSDLAISYDDKISGNIYKISQASIKTGTITSRKHFDINVTAIILSNVPDLNLKINITSMLALNLSGGIYDIDNLVITAQPNIVSSESLTLEGNIHIQQESLRIDGHLNSNVFNPRKLFSQLNIKLPVMAGTKAFESLVFSSNFQSDGKSLDVSNLNVTLDDFNIKGFLNVANLKTKAIEFKFNGNNLNLDNYLPEVTSNAAAKSAGESKLRAVENEQPLIPEELLKSLNIKGAINLSSLMVKRLKFDKPFIMLNGSNSRLETKLKSIFYQGRINMDGVIDVKTKGIPKLRSVASFKGINLQDMATSLHELKTVQGTINADVNIHTQGQLKSILTKNLNGTVMLGIDEGAFTEANFDKMVCESIAKIRKKNIQKTDWGRSTKFKTLGGTFVISNGVVRNKDLTASLSNLNLKGDGNINLVEQSIDYHIGLNIRGNEALDSDPACQVNKDYLDVTWPIRYKGQLGMQRFSIDSERLASTIASLAKKDIKSKIGEEIDKKVKGPLKDMLKRLFK